MSTRSIICKQCGNDSWETDIFNNVANCINCHAERPFYPRSTQTDKMSLAQEEMISFIKETVLDNDSHGYKHTHEYKKFEVKLLEWGTVQVLTEVGGKNDEGTMAAIFCRVRRQIFVGRKGGLTLCNPARFVKDEDGRAKKVFKKGYIKGPKALIHPSI